MRYFRALLVLLVIAFGSTQASAQSTYCPASTFGSYGSVPTPGQWQLCLNSLQQSLNLPINSIPYANASGSYSAVTIGTGLTFSGGTLSFNGTGAVTSFNTRTGAVTLLTADITSAGGATSGANSNITSLSGLTTPLSVPQGGTNAATASGTSLDNITGFSSTGFVTRTGAGTYAFQSFTNGITLANVVQGAANTVLANATGSTANYAAFSMPSCSASGDALNWTSGTGFTCGTGLGMGTVTNVDVSGGSTGLTTSGGPITTSGTITFAGTLGLGYGGTGQTTKAAAYNALTPLTTTGDTIYEASASTAARLPIGSAGQVYTVVGSIPAWVTPTSGVSVVNGWINGFTLSNDGTTPNSVLDVALGYASDSTNAVMIGGTAFTKSTAGTWIAGTGNHGMGTGLTIAANTWYHVFAIVNAGSYDVYFDTSPTAANAPASTTVHRYIGDFLTNGSSQIMLFTQIGQRVMWPPTSPIQELNAGGTTPLGNLTLAGVPTGFSVYPILNACIVGSPAAGDIVLASRVGLSSSQLQFADMGIEIQTVGYIECSAGQTISNTSAQVAVYSNTSTGTARINTQGYINPHLAPNF